MATWYRTSRSRSTEIVPVEVVRETESMLFLPPDKWRAKGVRVLKWADYEQYWSSFEAARQHLLTRARYAVKGHAEALSIAESNVALLEKMQNPEG